MRIMKNNHTVVMLVTLAALSQAQSTHAMASGDGRCPNDEPYVLLVQTQLISGKPVKQFTYEGPLGKGFVLSSVSTEEAIRYVCKEPGVGRWLADDGDEQ